MSRARYFGRTGAIVVVLVAFVYGAFGIGTPAESAEPSEIGSWSAPFDLPVKGIHMAVLPDGRVILFSYPGTAVGSDAWVWDPASGSLQDVSLGLARDLFCAAHSVLPDGKVFVSGGHVPGGAYSLGVKETDLYDPVAQVWQRGPDMALERWYPTSLENADGRVFIFGGIKDKTTSSDTVEVYDPTSNTISTLPATATKKLNNYPRMHLLPNGKFALTNFKRTEVFDPATNAWSFVTNMLFGGRGEKSTSVLLPGLNQIMIAGGENPTNGVTNTAEIIDFASGTPTWRYTAPMNFPRVWANAVVLPDGTVLEVGGGTGGTYTNPVKEAELYDPQTETWTVMAAQQAPRVYHSTAMLLPDGRVLSAGQDSGTQQFSAEIFSPPYLFKGPRPTITAAAPSVAYGEQFSISTPDAASITKAVLIRPGSVTHSINFDQRSVELSFTATDGNTLQATSPASATHAPPGRYMLFLVNAAGVPSVASWVNVATPPPPAAPSISGFSPSGGAVGTSVTVTGAHFTGTTGVRFNGVAAVFTVNSDAQITATVPQGATTGRIQVTGPGGSAASATDFTVPPPPVSSYQATVSGDGPVGYWRLGETTGGAVDTAGHAAAGAYNGGIIRGAPGAIAGDADGSAGFDGVNDYVSVPDNAFVDVGDVFTYEMWVKRGAARGVTQRFVHKGAGPAAFGFGANNKLVLLPGGTGAVATASSATAIIDSDWHHVVATKNGADTRIYVDGVNVTVAGTNATMTSNATALNVGRTSSSSAYFDGQIDEVAIYPTALTAQQVAAHHQAGLPPPPPVSPYQATVLGDGPAGYWRLGETTGAALDAAGHSAGGTYNGGVVRGAPGAIAGDADGSAGFDGVNDYVSVPDNAFVDVGDIFTYEMWVKRGAARGVTQRFIHKGGGPAAFGFGANNKLVLLPGGTGAVATASSAAAINDSNWHHVVATKNGADTRIYVDGVNVTVAGTNATMVSNATALNVGRTSSGSGYFDGQIDELAIYPTALTAQQVAAHNQAGRTG